MTKIDVQSETPYESFVFAIRSPVTIEKYLGRIAGFISYVGITDGNIEKKCNILGEKSNADSKWLVNNVIRYLRVQRNRVERREISASTLSGYIKPIKLFCEQLEISLPWKRITRGMPKGKRYANDWIPTVDEIKRIIEYPDRRIKPIVFTMASSGIRLGAWSYLKWGHISPVEKEGEIVAGRLRVYAEEEDYIKADSNFEQDGKENESPDDDNQQVTTTKLEDKKTPDFLPFIYLQSSIA